VSVRVPLTQGFVAVVDDSDAALVGAHKWYAHRSRDRVYATTKVEGRLVYLHRFLMDPKAGEVVDHKNHDTMDYRRANLRTCSRSSNGANRRSANPNNTSGFRGVTWNALTSKWRAQVKVGHRTRYVGEFATPELAAVAYDEAALEAFGAFATLNFPQE